MEKRERIEDFKDAALHSATKRRKCELLAWNWPATFTLDVLEFKEFAQRPDAYAKLCAMISSSIYGHVNVKKAIVCLLFGDSKKRLQIGVRLRGEIYVLLFGDSSIAKSQMLQTAEQEASLVDSIAPSLALPKAISNAVS
ncbi:DNA replication licensing factor MCM3 like [Dendrobium catenatum]|uniref:DNA replication licensing factor MCM3 like n=1 Tax=Dendrobium catenatum TaxID=906689 RepID=A0A2I0X373_9ASPA|nr:DNA replication licensing factor MCM3 like [Dendrobium catenatum]